MRWGRELCGVLCGYLGHVHDGDLLPLVVMQDVEQDWRRPHTHTAAAAQEQEYEARLQQHLACTH